jgi:hypothetical protein
MVKALNRIGDNMKIASIPDKSLELRDRSLSQAEQDYLFDLRGYRIIPRALSPEDLRAINAFADQHDTPDRKPGDWIGDVEVQTYQARDGINFQNIIEGGPVFEKLIDNPAWMEQVSRYIVAGDHQVRIDECFLNLRNRGGFISAHSGGANVRVTGTFRWHTGQWAVGQINVLMAITDIGPGDGATTIVPGSHHSGMHHPAVNWRAGVGAQDVVGMQEVHMKAGDALLFTDALCHGSMPRTTPGQRRVLIYRYTPNLVASRFNYIPSEELISRLSPAQRRLVMPIAPRLRPGRTFKSDTFPADALDG